MVIWYAPKGCEIGNKKHPRLVGWYRIQDIGIYDAILSVGHPWKFGNRFSWCWNILGWLGQYNRCWWPGDWRNTANGHVVLVACRTNRSLSFRRKDSICLHKLSVEKRLWRHQMETFSALLAICAGNSPVIREFPAQRPVTRSFDDFFDLGLNKRLSKQSWGWWFETLSRPLWRHCDG